MRTIRTVRHSVLGLAVVLATAAGMAADPARAQWQPAAPGSSLTTTPGIRAPRPASPSVRPRAPAQGRIPAPFYGGLPAPVPTGPRAPYMSNPPDPAPEQPRRRS